MLGLPSARGAEPSPAYAPSSARASRLSMESLRGGAGRHSMAAESRQSLSARAPEGLRRQSSTATSTERPGTAHAGLGSRRASTGSEYGTPQPPQMARPRSSTPRASAAVGAQKRGPPREIKGYEART